MMTFFLTEPAVPCFQIDLSTKSASEVLTVMEDIPRNLRALLPTESVNHLNDEEMLDILPSLASSSGPEREITQTWGLANLLPHPITRTASSVVKQGTAY